MKGIIKQLITLILIILVVAAGYYCYKNYHTNDRESSSRVHTIDKGRIKDIKSMVRLCSMEMYEETGIKDKINGKGLFAIQRLRGTISFDVENLRIDSIGVDSVRVYLPKERVQWLESTEADSYRIVDIWNESMPLLKANLTTAEENELKRRAMARAGRLAVERGYVARARKSAVSSLQSMFAPLADIYVEVTDTAAN